MRIRVKYNISPSIQLRVPRKCKLPEHPKSDGIPLRIDLFDLGLHFHFQPFSRKMFSDMKIAPKQLSLPAWRLLTGLKVLWLEVFGNDISYKDLRGLYQLKKPTGLSIAYFTTWGVHSNLVNSNPLLKKGYRYGWFVLEGEWGRGIPVESEGVQVQNSFNEDSACFLLHISLYIYISYSVLLGTFVDITWFKGTCPVREVGRKVSYVIERFRSL